MLKRNKILLTPEQDKEKPQAVRTANIMAARGQILCGQW